MYHIIPQQIPQDRRAEINEKILFCIDTGKNELPAETIYNCYTGIGGLHNLRQEDYANYHEYSQAKKEFEIGQFFTPHEICRNMVGLIKPNDSDMILDMCCGMGNFFNHLPVINDFKDEDGNDIMQQQIDRNYNQIKRDVINIIEDEKEYLNIKKIQT